MSTSSLSTPELTPSRSPTPAIERPPITQPDHFYSSDPSRDPPVPPANDRWFHPDQDPFANRGIPVFKPTMEEFADFETYMTNIEAWGMKSGIVKVIPPPEWRQSLPDIKPLLSKVKIRSPIEQIMDGTGGKYRQTNHVHMSKNVKEWVDLCNRDEFAAPSVHQVGHGGRVTGASPAKSTKRSKARGSKSRDTSAVVVKDEDAEDCTPGPASHETTPAPGKKRHRATAAEASKMNSEFLETFDPHVGWLPTHTTAEDYTPEFCNQLERVYWRNCGIGSPWYGADTPGSLLDDTVSSWNIANLETTLSRLLPLSQGLPGVNTPYLYFGMWRATFAWHLEDMDLFSINYIHFGAPKFWYAMPQGRSGSFEHALKSIFPGDARSCPQFLRHKGFLVSPNIISSHGCGKPNTCVQQAGEFIITYPRGYHAGFNLGLNCAESVNFALDSWISLGRKAQICHCRSDSVRINVDQLLAERALERGELPPMEYTEEYPGEESDLQTSETVIARSPAKKRGRKPKLQAPTMDTDAAAGTKRKASGSDPSPAAKKARIGPKPKAATTSSSGLKLRIPAPEEVEFPCCLCISMSRDGLLRVFDPPIGRKDVADTEHNLPTMKHGGQVVKDPYTGLPQRVWMAHEECAKIVPETWVDEVEDPRFGYHRGTTIDGVHTGTSAKQKMVFGVDGIVKDRWALKCVLCSKTRPKAHGAPVQCTKGKCPKAFHISCAKQDGQPASAAPDGTSATPRGDTMFEIAREVEKEVVLVDGWNPPPEPGPSVPSASVNEAAVLPAQTSTSNLPDTWPSFTPEYQADQPVSQQDSRVIKTIHKYEFTLLCPQHNPVVALRKKASKQNKIRDSLLSLPPLSRIKIRVSAGVFEVTLVRVIEETGSVEVLWDERGMRREFKWGSVIWGDCHGVEVKMGPTNVVTKPEGHVPTPRASPVPDHAGSYSGGYAPGSAATLGQTAYWAPYGNSYYPSAGYYSDTPPHHAVSAPSTSVSTSTKTPYQPPSGQQNVLQLYPLPSPSQPQQPQQPPSTQHQLPSVPSRHHSSHSPSDPASTVQQGSDASGVQGVDSSLARPQAQQQRDTHGIRWQQPYQYDQYGQVVGGPKQGYSVQPLDHYQNPSQSAQPNEGNRSPTPASSSSSSNTPRTPAALPASLPAAIPIDLSSVSSFGPEKLQETIEKNPGLRDLLMTVVAPRQPS